MNCSQGLGPGLGLRRLLRLLWREMLGAPAAANASAPQQVPEDGAAAAAAAAGEGEDDAYLYILLIMIFYGCLAGGLILAYTRSRKLESKHDPYHLYIERDWTAAGGGCAAVAPGGAAAAAAEPCPEARADRRSSGESELL